MSNETRNRRFATKSRKFKAKSGENKPIERRSSGMRAHNNIGRPESPKNSPKHRDPRKSKGRGREGGSGWIWGLHAVRAVLANKSRTIHQILTTDKGILKLELPERAPSPKIVLPQLLDKQFGLGSAHQGVAVKAAPLEWPDISDISDAKEEGLILVLDQITDPHNVGAMLRLSSAFGVSALVMQSRHAPPLSGALAKVAVGCLETVPVCQVTNIANTLETLKKSGWMVTGLAGETELELSTALKDNPKQVIVMGAEGPGLRDRVKKTCDQLARIPMMSSNLAGEAESLNVATAAAIALYEARRG